MLLGPCLRKSWELPPQAAAAAHAQKEESAARGLPPAPRAAPALVACMASSRSWLSSPGARAPSSPAEGTTLRTMRPSPSTLAATSKAPAVSRRNAGLHALLDQRGAVRVGEDDDGGREALERGHDELGRADGRFLHVLRARRRCRADEQSGDGEAHHAKGVLLMQAFVFSGRAQMLMLNYNKSDCTVSLRAAAPSAKDPTDGSHACIDA